MLSAIGNLLQKTFAKPAPEPEAEAHRARLAAAALLVEVIGADHEIAEQERHALLAGLRERFSLTDQEASVLVAAAEQRAQQATDLFQSTSEINRLFSEQQKRWLIEELWRAAYADEVLHRHEEHLVRKVADLIYVPHREMLAAKHRVAASRS